MPWKRPSSVPYPSVWGRCTGRKPMPDGQLPKFRIQDAPEEMFDEIVDHMATIFTTGEPISVSTKFIEDSVSVAEFRKVWRAALNDKLCLVAILELPDGTEKLAGTNITCISLVENKDRKPEFQGVAMQKVFGTVSHLTSMVNVFEKYGVDFYMTAYGLSVSPEYQGQGLGLELLKARVPLCKATAIKVTATIFVAGNAAELARRAGFELLAEKEISIQKESKDGVPGTTTLLCKNMAMRIE